MKLLVMVPLDSYIQIDLEASPWQKNQRMASGPKKKTRKGRKVDSPAKYMHTYSYLSHQHKWLVLQNMKFWAILAMKIIKIIKT